MSKFFCLTKNPIRKIKSKRKRMKIDIRVLNIIVLGLVVFIGISYLIQINTLATKGYQIRELETKVTQLEKESKTMELQVLELQSMDNVKNKVSQLNMVDVGKVEYLMPTPVVFANR